MRHGWVVALLAGSTLASADEIHLRNGGRLVGEVRERRANAIVVETGPGLITVPMSQVARVVTSTSALASYQARAARLNSQDAEGWFELAMWASEQGLNTQARRAIDHVLSIHPNHSGAHQAAGHRFVGGRWMTAEESYRAQGLVPFEGSWVTPDDRQAILIERAAAAEERRARAEGDARIREAEARARAAEAEARRMEAEAAQTSYVDTGGFPYPWVFGGGGAVLDPFPIDPMLPPPVVIVRPPPPPPQRDGRGDGDGRRQSSRPARGSSRGWGQRD